MRGMLGAYPMSREASGTAWQPEAAPMGGVHGMQGDWMWMAHGFANLIYDHQGGRRGRSELISTNMGMGMAQRPWGPGTFGVRSMVSLEPATVGPHGYPLLLQTGETADGKDTLIDHQHPHDLFMELAALYSLPVSGGSAFVYAGMPGEPALGPPTFMHRFSGMDNPEAPITHHWLDSTHITYGVGTLGYIWNNRWKAEASIFTGREPDENRWDFDKPKFDSYSARLSWNPSPAWAFQGSYGVLDSPEQLEPEVDAGRATASAGYHKRLGAAEWQTTFAWGVNREAPGSTLHGFLLESACVLRKTHTFFGRAETVEKDELFPEGDPLHGTGFQVTKLSLGYIYDFPEWNRMRWGIGGLGSVHFLPDDLEETYDDTPASFMLFARVKL